MHRDYSLKPGWDDLMRQDNWHPNCLQCSEVTMLYYALVFLPIALVGALLGFSGLAVAFAGIAKLLFVMFLVLFLVSLVMHRGRRV